MEGQTDGRKDGSVTISLRNFVGEGIIHVTRRHNICLFLDFNTYIQSNLY